ncbi:MAG: M48 family metallopeptidase [Myxococcota bacterium]
MPDPSPLVAPPPRPDRAVGRGVVVLLLGLGFYVLALASVAACIGIVVGLAMSPQIPVKLMLLAAFAALAIVWGLLPRWRPFVAPGPRLRREAEPRFFDWLDRIAQTARQAPPREVYLVPQVNAFVTERRGFLGLGRTRIMGVGLPLLQSLSEAELGAVIGHELGHFAGGDVALGTWVFRIRNAILRVIQSMRSSIIVAPFVGYAKFFFRVSSGISREQELAADAVSARVAGSRAAVSALGDGIRRATVHGHYLAGEVLPMARAGFAAPVVAGWQQFTASPLAAEVRAELQASPEEPPGEYDTHPPTSERIAALLAHPHPGALDLGDAPAVALFDDFEACARAVFEHLTEKKLAPLRWEEVPEKVLLPSYRAFARERRRAFDGRALGDLVDQHAGIAAALRAATPGISDDDVRRATAIVIMVALVDAGWSLDTAPGLPVIARLGERSIDQRPLASLLATRSGPEWRRHCADLGIDAVTIRLAAP